MKRNIIILGVVIGVFAIGGAIMGREAKHQQINQNDYKEQKITITKKVENKKIEDPEKKKEVQDNPVVKKDIIEYIIKKGDTLGSIANKFGISLDTITIENNLSSKSLIQPGMKLNILPVSGISYKVIKGDTLLGIANKYKVDQEEIVKTNNLNNDLLTIGQKIIIPGAEKRYVAVRSYKPKIVYKKKTSNIVQASATTQKYSYSSIQWTRGALNELYKTPSFARSIIKNKINNYARSHNIRIITKQLFENIHV